MRDVAVDPVVSPRRGRAGPLLLLLTLCAVAIVAGIVVARKLGGTPTMSSSVGGLAQPLGELRYKPASPAPPGPPGSGGTATPLLQPSALDPLAFNPGYQTMTAEPGGLDAFPGYDGGSNGGVHHERRYRIADEGVIDEVSFWRIDRDARPLEQQVRDVFDHYARAAAGLGLTHRAQPTPDTPDRTGPTRRRSQTALFSNPGAADPLLTIRVASHDTQLHLTVWLRYAEDR